MGNITQDQREAWLKEGCCHICGKNDPHGHPTWMWLANPVPVLKKETKKQKLYREKSNEINEVQIKSIIGI